jgi:hypothetical protein
MDGFDPVKLGPALAGPGGAIVALLAFIGYLIREISVARGERDKMTGERDKYRGRCEELREQRDEFRFLAGDATRAGKRAAQTAVALGAHDTRHYHQSEDEA